MEYNIVDAIIKRIVSFDTKRDGSPLVTRNNDPYKKVLIDLDPNCIDDMEFTGTVSMLDFDNIAEDWAEGTKITGKIIHNGDFWNFEVPKVSAKDRIKELENEVEKLKGENFELRSKVAVKELEEIEPDDLPF